MSTEIRQPSGYRFGVFELDLEARELRKQGRRIKLQEKPFQTLALLLEHTGEVVSRDQLREHLWPADTFVQFDDNLNTAVKRVREALGDSAENPRYVETVPRRGYRFLPPVEVVPAATATPKLRTPLAIAAILTAALVLVGVGRLLPAGSHTVHPEENHRIMLAVLPFRNLSGDAAQEYISDGMTEELIAHLGRMNPSSLRVIARSSVMRYKTAPQDAADIGRALGVAYLLEGSLRRSGSRIGVTAQLVETRDRTQVWTETYERPASDLLTIQREVARGIAEALALRLLPEQEASLARASTTNTAAYDAYLNGLHEWNRGTKEGFLASAAAFQQAAELDPNFALAHDGIARSYLSLTDYRFVSADEGYRTARHQVETALRLDETIPQSHELSAEVMNKTDPDAAGADDAYRKAIALNPSDAYALRVYAMYLLGKHRNADAVSRISEAARLDPLSPGTLCYAAYIYYLTNDYARSRQQADRALALDANFPFAWYVQGHLHVSAGRLADAISDYQKAVVASGRTPKYLYFLADTYVKSGQKNQAEQLLAELKKQSETGYVPPEFIQKLSEELR